MPLPKKEWRVQTVRLECCHDSKPLSARESGWRPRGCNSAFHGRQAAFQPFSHTNIGEMWGDQFRLHRFQKQLGCVKKAQKMAKDAGFSP